MMKLMFMLLFMIPLSFFNFWVFQFFMFISCLMFIFMFNLSFDNFNLSYFLSMDLFSYMFILLSLWICSLMVLASSKIYILKNFYNFFSFNVIILMISLVFLFSSLNLFIFYLFFEISLIPLMMIILGWGYQPERLMAGMYMVFYTLMFSLPMMIGLVMLKNFNFSLMFFKLISIDFGFLYFVINLVFFIKIPMFFLHLWLPKAHVEAPVSGSMILAGIMLKLGGYGLIRFMKVFLYYHSTFNLFFIVLSLVGGMYISLMCLYQTDMKSLIAYSSVSHMSLVLSGILSLNLFGYLGGFIMMIAHGLCSSGLFCLSNIYYERFYSRSFMILKGLINLMPSFSFFMFIFCSSNMSAPPSLNLVGEIMLLMSLISFNNILMYLLIFLCFFSASYSIYLYSFSQHGKMSSMIYSFWGGNNREFLLLALHWMPLNLMFLICDFFLFV
uniref:NADH-ubiquinone oxidoreductase chain 4 n=1 Tax=Downesia tarsata TaxID=2790390 RepID=A0A7T1C5C4_9CUCU|nr:NADH dehydrogenase subunit 4 [Downesia tarsata]QPM99433.1 NADH dehydrogenase subunit 4 [Downesia tarsata]